MDEKLAQHKALIKSRTKPSSKEKALALFLSFVSFPAFAENNAEISDTYTGNYQSYFHDEDDSLQRRHSTTKTDAQHSATHISSSPVKEGTATVQPSPSVPAALPSEASSTTLTENQTVAANNSDDVSLLRLRQEAPPVHWNNKNKNSGKFKLATIQAFLRHDELPNWYFGFWNAREDSYKGQFSNQDYKGTNTINELFVGHIFETWRGNIGTEVMVGSETATKRWKNRFKVWQDLRLSNKWSIAGYSYGEYQPQGNQPGNGDLEQYIFETEPAIQYRVNPDLGLYLRPYYYYNRQVRESWGDIVEQEWKVTAGFWRNWYPLLTSMYIGFGQDKIENASNAKELFYDGRYKFIGGTISYPVFGEVRLYGEFKASFTKETGLWTYTGHSWNPFTVVGVTYNF